MNRSVDGPQKVFTLCGVIARGITPAIYVHVVWTNWQGRWKKIATTTAKETAVPSRDQPFSRWLFAINMYCGICKQADDTHFSSLYDTDRHLTTEANSMQGQDEYMGGFAEQNVCLY